MADTDNRVPEPNSDPHTMPVHGTDNAPAYYGMEAVVPHTRHQMEGTTEAQNAPENDAGQESAMSGESDDAVGIEVINPHELVQELWPDSKEAHETP